MDDFGLTSVDWDTVRLLQAGQFKQETHYHEDLVRWVLQRGRVSGVLHLADDGISCPTPESERDYSICVGGCLGVTEQGRIIEIPEDSPVAGRLAANGMTVPIYAGVRIREREVVEELHPSADVGLLQCGGRRPSYAVSSDNSDTSVDWLQIGLCVKTEHGLAADPEYVPECMFISSHSGLWASQQQIQKLARQCLTSLERSTSDAVAVFSAAVSLASSLGPVSRGIDPRLHPHAYVDRLAGVLAAQNSQLLTLPKPRLANYQQATTQLAATLEYLDGQWTVGHALAMARSCFERLLALYPDLLRSLGAVAPQLPQAAPTREQIAVVSDDALRSDDAAPQYRRYTDPGPAPEERPVESPRRGPLWRR